MNTIFTFINEKKKEIQQFLEPNKIIYDPGLIYIMISTTITLQLKKIENKHKTTYLT